MKLFFAAVSLILGLFSSAQTVFTYPSLVVEYDSALVFRNLKIIPIRRVEPDSPYTVMDNRKLLALKSGLQKGQISIRERGNYMVDNINVLLIENKSEHDIIIRSGEIAMGGRQDRVFAKDTILPPSKEPYLVPVYCIEENRWSSHEKKFVYGGNTSAGLQKIIDSAHHQTKVWDEIRRLLKQNNQDGSSSFAALLHQRKFADTANVYLSYFFSKLRGKDSTITGFVVSTGNRVLGADVFVSPSFFYQTLGNLLEKYTAEAILSGSKPAVQHTMEKKYADQMLEPASQTQFLTEKGKRFFYKSVLIQITGY